MVFLHISSLIAFLSVISGIQALEKINNLSYCDWCDNKLCKINASLPCPSWSFCGSDGTCKCPQIPHSLLKCSVIGKISGILTCNCITYDEDSNLLEIGMCYYGCHSKNISQYPYRSLPSNMSEWNEFMCGRFNRQGTLCGQCKDGYYTSVYSYDLTCVKCPDGSSNLLKFIFIAFVPLTFFYIVILTFKISVHSTYLQGYVLFSQAITILPLARHFVFMTKLSRPFLKYILYSVGTIYGVWNLDFFRYFNHHICFKINSLAATSLDLLVAVYPLLLIATSYALIYAHDHQLGMLMKSWRVFKAFFKVLEFTSHFKNSLADALSTFIFLLGIKCINVCADFLLPVRVYLADNPQNFSYEYRLYYDASISYFGPEHLPYGVLGLIVFLLVGVIPTLLLFLFPLQIFQHFIVHVLPESSIIYLHIFMDTIQGCFKNGTEKGTVDLRWFSGIIFGVRIFFTIVFGLTLNISFYALAASILILFVIVFIIAEPYKARFRHLSVQFVIFVLLIAAICVVCIISSIDELHHMSLISVILLFLIITIPLCYIVCLISYFIIFSDHVACCKVAVLLK